VAPSPVAAADPRPRRVALGGAAICLALTTMVALTTRRSRRRDAVTRD
jgi:membrane-anchored mycosin MYCP